jgi:D-beta-D-heptose 7-phosphate kinase/D-beta-D-heptose 1-phosphate adenosyltransferase
LSIIKIKTIAALQKLLPRLKKQGKKIVFTNGCFDILHYGHVHYLEKAKKKGDILVVALNSDASVRRLKGAERPIVPERDRARVLAALESVDYVVLFNEDTPLAVLHALKPDILVKGADWSKDKIVGADFILSYGGEVTTIKLAKGRSTTNILNKIESAIGKKRC